VLVSYVGTKGADLQQIRDVNLDPLLLPGTIGVAGTGTMLPYLAYSSTRPLPGFNRILLFDSTGTSSYNGVVVQANRRVADHLQLLCSYTFSKVIDNKPNVYALNTGPGAGGVVSYPPNPAMDRGPGDNDQRHRFVLGGVWDLRYGSRRPRLFSVLLSGWQLSGIFTAQSGRPYSGLIEYDLNNDGDFGTDRTPGLARNTFHAPATVSLDPRVTRKFSLGRIKLEFIGEAFNITNHANIVDVNHVQLQLSRDQLVCGRAAVPCLAANDQGPDGFRAPVASSGARIVQLALRASF
jgi:hypothetical protein